MELNFERELYVKLRNMEQGKSLAVPWGQNLAVFQRENDNVTCNIYADKVMVYEKTIPVEYSQVGMLIHLTYNRSFNDVVNKDTRHVVSNSKQYMYSIEHFDEYKLNLESKEAMLMLLNILEAHGETLESFGDYTSYAFENSGVNDRADAAEFALETNAFFSSWNDYVLFIEYGEDITEFKEFLTWNLMHSNLEITTDGIVELNIV